MTSSQVEGIGYGRSPAWAHLTPTVNKFQGSLLAQPGQCDIRVKLLTKALLKQLPPLYATEGQSDPLIICKFFYPDFGWTWYVVEVRHVGVGKIAL